MFFELDLPPAVLAALTSRFTLERQIGAGGMATVFLGRSALRVGVGADGLGSAAGPEGVSAGSGR
ncbi:MAG: hypothetical protein ABI877_06305 [Gemmatimonadaceae bacterium]